MRQFPGAVKVLYKQAKPGRLCLQTGTEVYVYEVESGVQEKFLRILRYNKGFALSFIKKCKRDSKLEHEAREKYGLASEPIPKPPGVPDHDPKTDYTPPRKVMVKKKGGR